MDAHWSQNITTCVSSLLEKYVKTCNETWEMNDHVLKHSKLVVAVMIFQSNTIDMTHTQISQELKVLRLVFFMFFLLMTLSFF